MIEMPRDTNHVDIITPKRDCFRGGNQFERQDSEPRKSIFPTTGEAPGLVDEADNVSVEGTVDGVEDGHLGESQGGEQQHETDDDIWIQESVHFRLLASGVKRAKLTSNDQRSGTTLVKGTTRTDEETCTDGTADGNHLHVAVAQVTLEVTLLVGRADFLIVRLGVDGGSVLLILLGGRCRRHGEGCVLL
jgi:hypothetical protein